ncbi:holin [Clostridium sp. FP1]|uniref:holin n=1 Tax=Clostridium sp. FP1 TaxID=2724076 RepID=UPI0013E9504E|nr:holin [Clostridium sp. FP1]MBZ9635482.1 holin [Clostridium sp. FP1]
MDKSRFKNYGLWVSIFAFIPILLQAFGLNILPVNYTEVVNGLLGILVLGGILSNPNDGNGYIDK